MTIVDLSGDTVAAVGAQELGRVRLELFLQPHCAPSFAWSNTGDPGELRQQDRLEVAAPVSNVTGPASPVVPLRRTFRPARGVARSLLVPVVIPSAARGSEDEHDHEGRRGWLVLRRSSPSRLFLGCWPASAFIHFSSLNVVTAQVAFSFLLRRITSLFRGSWRRAATPCRVQRSDTGRRAAGPMRFGTSTERINSALDDSELRILASIFLEAQAVADVEDDQDREGDTATIVPEPSKMLTPPRRTIVMMSSSKPMARSPRMDPSRGGEEDALVEVAGAEPDWSR